VREAARSSWPPGAHLAFTFLAGVFFATLVGLALTGRPGLLVGSLADQLAGRIASIQSSPRTASPLGQPGTASAADVSPIQAVIQRADAEQVEAIIRRDPSIMADTPTSSHYQEPIAINQDLLDHGGTSIALAQLDWGAITVGDGTASATADETWTTTYADGATEQSRDRNVYSLVQEGGAWKIQGDEHPGSPRSANRAAPSGQQPGSAAITGPSGQATSHNWSGYAATGGSFSAVSGTWTVPQPSTEGSFGADAVWVGIGGVRSRDLLQAGTDEAVSGSGQALFRAWIETLPQTARPIPLAIHPGDSVSVSITQQGSDSWLVAFVINTTGQPYQQTERYSSSGSSAEWVVEAPFASRGVLPLDDFGTVGFSSGSTVKDGQSMSIEQAGAQPITMIGQRNLPLAIPSALGEQGTSFSVNRTTVPSSGQASGFPSAPRASVTRPRAAWLAMR